MVGPRALGTTAQVWLHGPPNAAPPAHDGSLCRVGGGGGAQRARGSFLDFGTSSAPPALDWVRAEEDAERARAEAEERRRDRAEARQVGRELEQVGMLRPALGITLARPCTHTQCFVAGPDRS
jgi:hypothetical protein